MHVSQKHQAYLGAHENHGMQNQNQWLNNKTGKQGKLCTSSGGATCAAPGFSTGGALLAAGTSAGGGLSTGTTAGAFCKGIFLGLRLKRPGDVHLRGVGQAVEVRP